MRDFDWVVILVCDTSYEISHCMQETLHFLEAKRLAKSHHLCKMQPLQGLKMSEFQKMVMSLARNEAV